MKRTMMMAMMAVGLLCGCANTGLFGRLQAADEALAAKYGVPVPAVSQLRTFLGIPDARTLPAADRVLPQPWTWYYDVLDKDGHVVDTSQFSWGTIPRVRQSGTNGAMNVFGPVAPIPTSQGVATLEGLLQILSDNPALLTPASATTNATPSLLP